MRRIKIQHFGPIKEGLVSKGSDGFIEIDKLTVFIGEQGSGKSTVAKLLSTLAFLEKQLVMNKLDELKTVNFDGLIRLLKYHSLENLITTKTTFTYDGNYFIIDLKEEKLSISNSPFHIIESNVSVQIIRKLYIPAERNIVTSVDNASNMKYLADDITDFIGGYQYASKENKGKKFQIPIKGYFITTNDFGVNYLNGSDFEIPLHKASSGFQSISPLALTLSQINKEVLANFLWELLPWEREYKVKIKGLFSIIEEPEQNLFPSSQEALLRFLISIINSTEENSMLLTTHSPYLVNYLSILMYANKKYRTVEEKSKKALEKVALESETLNAKTVRVYEFKADGSIKLSPIKSDLVDDNYALNKSFDELDKDFSILLNTK